MSDTSFPSSDTELSDLYRSISLPRDGKCIRVLDVEIGQTSDPTGGPLRSSMRVVDLEDHPSFTALSYVWQQRTTATDESYNAPNILCNEVTVPITANCFSALLHLRKKLGNFTVWIDAVCINQTDKQESSFQIPLMGDIYSGAQEVYLWLGEGNEATDRAMAYLGKAGFLEHYLRSVKNEREMPLNSQIWTAAWSVLSALFSPTRHPFPFLCKDLTPTWQFPLLRRHIALGSAIYATYYDLSELLDRAWTKRIWTYQEIMLASNPFIVCGHAHLPWSRFAVSILFLDHIRPPRATNLDIPIDLTIQTWKKLVLSRERLLRALIPDGKEKNKIQKATQVYRELVTTREDTKEVKQPRSFDIEKYQQFLFEIFNICSLILNTIVALAYLSLLNFLAASITSSYKLCQDSISFSKRVGFIIYISLSTFLFFIIFPYYIIMIYSHFHKTSIYAHSHSVHRVRRREDATDDFVNAIVTRHATQPRDMAFGLQTVLERRLGKPIPAPNYEASLAQIYRELTVNLFDATGQLQSLLLAAGNKMYGQPSWVPDWSAQVQNFWLQPFALRQARASRSKQTEAKHIGSGQQHISSDRIDSCQNNNPQRLWSFESSRKDALTIFAHPFGTITQILPIQQTQTDYDPLERHIHLENISSLLAVLHSYLFSSQIDIHFFTNRQNFPSLNSAIPQHHLRLYYNFIWYSRARTPDRILELLIREDNSMHFPMPYGFTLPLWLSMTHKELFETHVAICNDLARTGRQFFKARAEGRGKVRNDVVAGVCGKDAGVEDKLLLVPGLMSLLVTRKVEDLEQGENGSMSGAGEKRIELVSPAVVFILVEREVEERGPERLKSFVVL